MKSIHNLNDRLHEIWKIFLKSGQLSKADLREDIFSSWLRCQDLNIDPYQKKVKVVSDPDQLKCRINASRVLIDISLPVMETLYKFVSGSGFIVTLVDAEGIILHTIGDEDVKRSFARGNFLPGADWSEKSAGTNAIGLSLALERPIQTFGYEHFCICSQGTTCSSAPIRNMSGQIVGALDMSGDIKSFHSHTLGMVVASVHGIEKQIELQDAWNRCQVADNYKHAIMESLSEGVLATDKNGLVVHINSFAKNILEFSKNDILGHDFRIFLKPSHSLVGDYNLTQKLIDEEVNIHANGKIKKGTITTQVINEIINEQDGAVILINEISRTKKLVQRMSGAESKLTFDNVIGQNSKFLASVRLAKTAASSFSNVLLLGESGTGKDVFAQAIHNASQCSSGPFVAINCAAIPRELISSELFGYAEGAFTGAKRGGQPGKFEMAEGGTIFLDEIGEMPLELQTMLLRVVEQRVVTRVGGREVLPINVRLIAATNRNLHEEVEKGNFRRDLYYRLNVISIPLIPLREHKDDIPILAEAFIKRMNNALGKNIREVHNNVWEAFQNYDWPGNVREFFNYLERAMNLAEDSVLNIDVIPQEILREKEKKIVKKSFSELEKELISSVLSECEGNISIAAKKLGVARSTLYRKIEKYSIVTIQ